MAPRGPGIFFKAPNRSPKAPTIADNIPLSQFPDSPNLSTAFFAAPPRKSITDCKTELTSSAILSNIPSSSIVFSRLTSQSPAMASPSPAASSAFPIRFVTGRKAFLTILNALESIPNALPSPDTIRVSLSATFSLSLSFSVNSTSFSRAPYIATLSISGKAAFTASIRLFTDSVMFQKLFHNSSLPVLSLVITSVK